MIIPVAPGTTAAVGLLKTDLRYEHTEAVIVELGAAGLAELARINAARDLLCDRVTAELDADGIARAEQRIEILAECRYRGQGFELRAEIPEGAVTAANKDSIAISFHARHRLDYGYSYRAQEVELITLRAIGSASVPRITIPRIARTDGSSPDRALVLVRPTTFDDGCTLKTPRYDRRKLLARDRIEGPAILVQHHSNTLVPPGHVAEMLDHGNIPIRPVGIA